MPRVKQAEHATPAAEAVAERSPATEAAAQEPPAKAAPAEKPVYAADPHSKISVSLSEANDGPSMHLLRSHKFKQMQVRFDGEQPDEQYRKMLTEKGWKDRTEKEGVYTKQIDPNAGWQSVQKMEQEFRDVANAVRKDKGLGPVLEGLAA